MKMLKVKVLLLNTKNISKLWSYKERNLYYNQANFNDIDETIYKHLYLTSNKEIKKNDYFICNKTIMQAVRNYDKSENLEINKIEATTDKSLELPLIPESFIKKYIEKQGQVNEIMIEIEEFGGQIINNELKSITTTIKTRNDNTVIIHKIKDSWNKEELKQIAWQAYTAKLPPMPIYEINEKLIPEFNLWFEQLKF